MPKPKPRDPNQRAKATVDQIIAKTERSEPEHGIRLQPGGPFEAEVWFDLGNEPPIRIKSEETRPGTKR
jgi:hypothetical protein